MSDTASLTTFLITDIEGSSLKWLNHREAMQGALTTHDAILREAITTSGGEVFKTAGDAFYAAFAMPAAAVKAAARAQQDLSAADWSSIGGLKVRMAIHTGTAQSRAGDYFGPALNRVARLLALAHGGQILTTDSVARLVMAEREAHSAVLLGRQALDDPAQPVEVYQVKGPGLVAEFPPLRMRDTNRTNLPQQPTVLVGREHELQTLAHHVANSRLTSLTGTGGVGKTRLAIASAGEHSAMFPDGIWLVEFAPLSDPGLLPGAVATAVGLQLAPNVPPLQALANQMQLMDTLLIFDNCEHVIEAVAEMAEQLLNVTRRVRIIATTQEPLGVAGEQVMRLPSLSLPPETATTAGKLPKPNRRRYDNGVDPNGNPLGIR